MKRDIYATVTSVTLLITLTFSLFLIVSDNLLPFTTQATVKTTSIDIVPEVSGYIDAFYVHEGETVQAGDPLFKIDARQYDIAKDKAEAQFLQAKSQWEKAQHSLKRVQSLSHKSLVSQEALDNARTAEKSAKATFLSAQADLDMAKLNVDRTLVKAQAKGIVTNLTYSKGMYVSTASQVVHLVRDSVKWIEVDFTEKGLSSLHINQVVNIVYDAIPNKVFHGKIAAIDHAINSGLNSKNQLGEISDETRWIRPQQKVRVRVVPEEKKLPLIAGSRASVMVRDGKKISDYWMTLLSWLRFIY